MAGWMAWICPLLGTFAYPAVFLVNLIGSASIFLPIPGFILVFFLAGMGLNPWLLAFFGALGAALGELTGFLIGAGGRKVAEKHKEKKEGLIGGFLNRMLGQEGWLEKAESWSKKRGIFALLIVFAATPLPDDVVGIVAGAIGYSWKKFLIAVFIGKFVMFLILAWGGFFGTQWVLELLGVGL